MVCTVVYFKASTDYANHSFPSSSCLLDVVRCSLTFNHPQSLIFGLQYFIDAMNQDGSPVTKIARIKNGFKDLLSDSKISYTDIKINAVYDSQTIGKSMIFEVYTLVTNTNTHICCF